MADEQSAQTQPVEASPETPAAQSGESTREAREIRGVGVLDLTGMRSTDDLAGITRIKNVGVILVPEPLMSRLGAISMEHVGTTVAIPVGDKVRVITGSLTLSGEALAVPTGDEDTLVVVGVLQVTTPVEKVAYRKLVVVGLVVAPKGSETAIGAAISRLEGAVVYYSGVPRIFTGTDRFSSAFFGFLEDQTKLVLAGTYTIEPDVTPELLKRKVGGINLAGTLKAPRALVPLLQALCVERQGPIVALEDEPERKGGD